MASERRLASIEDFREAIENPKSTVDLMEIGWKIVSRIKGIRQEERIYKDLVSQNGFVFSVRGGNIGIKTLEVWRHLTPKTEGITLIDEGPVSRRGFEGLRYFTEKERMKDAFREVVREEKDGRVIDRVEDSWTFDPLEPLVGESALPKAKEILLDLLDAVSLRAS